LRTLAHVFKKLDRRDVLCDENETRFRERRRRSGGRKRSALNAQQLSLIPIERGGARPAPKEFIAANVGIAIGKLTTFRPHLY
jgi:hypothetical protein